MLAEDYRITQAHARGFLGNSTSLVVNPTMITRQIKKTEEVNNDILQPRPFFEYFIVGGDWDVDFDYFHNDRNFKEMLELHRFREEYKETYSYRVNVEEYLTGIPQKDHRGVPFESISAIDACYEYYLSLIESMEMRGYMPFRDPGKEDVDIGLAITSEGGLFHFRTGHHRLAIAKILKLPIVKATVHLVHSAWVCRMQDIYNRDVLSAVKEGLINEQYTSQ